VEYVTDLYGNGSSLRRARTRCRGLCKEYHSCWALFRSSARPNATQEQTGGLCRGSALKRLALLEAVCQGASEDFVPPAAQRKAVRRTPEEIPYARVGRRVLSTA